MKLNKRCIKHLGILWEQQHRTQKSPTMRRVSGEQTRLRKGLLGQSKEQTPLGQLSENCTPIEEGQVTMGSKCSGLTLTAFIK